ncbi:MAG: ATP-binding protein [Gammaproteobacteria bacterium]|nr:ATP-binding protein [Gammaproteobacteria bacterium]MYD81296.1 ATP-binding protein [Gammaproteobacteria bacterium]
MEGKLSDLLGRAERVLERLERLFPQHNAVDWKTTIAATWIHRSRNTAFHAVTDLDPIRLDDLLEIDRQREAVVQNTAQFCAGLPANNVLLWGARGTGKSSLIHAVVNEFADKGLRLVEVDKRSLSDIALLAEGLQNKPFRFLVVCDDLSFDANDSGFKELKSSLEGTIFATVSNVLIYITSNRRHLVTELAKENQQLQEQDLHGAEAVEEKISLSDRFGLWLSFHPFDQDQYLRVVQHWLGFFSKQCDFSCVFDDEVRTNALRWALNRGTRSGRTANHFARAWISAKSLERLTQSESLNT